MLSCVHRLDLEDIVSWVGTDLKITRSRPTHLHLILSKIILKYWVAGVGRRGLACSYLLSFSLLNRHNQHFLILFSDTSQIIQNLSVSHSFSVLAFALNDVNISKQGVCHLLGSESSSSAFFSVPRELCK